MRLGIYGGAIGGALATWASIEAGVALEMVTVRALVVFLALASAGYVADLVVMTAPPPTVRHYEADEDRDESDTDGVNDRADEDRTPTSIAAARAERTATAPDRRAA